MARKQGGLGRNFYEILDDNLLETKKDSVTTLRVADIEPRRDQPRKDFDLEQVIIQNFVEVSAKSTLFSCHVRLPP